MTTRNTIVRHLKIIDQKIRNYDVALIAQWLGKLEGGRHLWLIFLAPLKWLSISAAVG